MMTADFRAVLNTPEKNQDHEIHRRRRRRCHFLRFWRRGQACASALLAGASAPQAN